MKEFPCNFCGRYFKTPRGVKLHEFKNHGVKSRVNRIISFGCPLELISRLEAITDNKSETIRTAVKEYVERNEMVRLHVGSGHIVTETLENAKKIINDFKVKENI